MLQRRRLFGSHPTHLSLLEILWLFALLAQFLCCIAAQNTVFYQHDSAKQSNLIASTGSEEKDSICECWKWPECVSNCTAKGLFPEQLKADHTLLARLPLPFIIEFPYQDRKSRPKYGTSTADKHGTYFMNTKFWIYLVNRQHVQLKLQKSIIFGRANSYSTLYYQSKERQVFGYESDKLDHCFYTGTARRDPNRPEPDSYVAVDTCHGLR
ncbi:unnamed protein product [Calicophoron daubneyi]